MGQIFQRTYRGRDGALKTCKNWTIRCSSRGVPIEHSAGTTDRVVAEAKMLALEGAVLGKGDESWKRAEEAAAILDAFLRSQNLVRLMKVRARSSVKHLTKKYPSAPRMQRMAKILLHFRAFKKRREIGKPCHLNSPHDLYGTKVDQIEVTR